MAVLPRKELKAHVCPACDKSYDSAQSLYQHKRTHHPELINYRHCMDYDLEDRRFVCPVESCDKCYTTSAGLYQHKRAKHPYLINERKRGYTRPEMRKPRPLPDYEGP